jgi:hypothetical protein
LGGYFSYLNVVDICLSCILRRCAGSLSIRP